MKVKLAAVSVAINVVLLVVVEWVLAENKAELSKLRTAMTAADEIQIHLLDRALVALQSTDPEQARATADLLRPIVENGQRNIEARREAGLTR
jgi:hypothetical protein